MNARILPLFALAAFCLPLSAAETPDRLNLNKAKEGEAATPAAFWTCIVGCPCDAVTMVKLENITSVSKQTYLLNNSIKMREVTIDTKGNNSIRFYCTASKQAKSAASRVSNARSLVESHTDGSTRFPGKKYPEGTYSHNVEYQVSSTEALDTIFDSVANAWQKNKGCTLRVE